MKLSSAEKIGLLVTGDNSARAFWVTGIGKGEIRAEQLPEPADGEVLIRTLYSGISRGTETLVFTVAVPVSE